MIEMPAALIPLLFWLSLANAIRLALAWWTSREWKPFRCASIEASFGYSLVGLALACLAQFGWGSTTAVWLCAGMSYAILILTLAEYPQLGFPIYLTEPSYVMIGPAWNIVRPKRRFLPSPWPGFSTPAKIERFITLHSADASREMRLLLTVSIGDGRGDYLYDQLVSQTGVLAERVIHEGDALLDATDGYNQVLTNSTVIEELSLLTLPGYHYFLEAI